VSSLTYTILTTSPATYIYLHNLVSVQSPRGTRSSSIAIRHTVPTRITKCRKFGQFILRKIIKIVATSCQILRLKCTQFDFGWGTAPHPAGGVYSAPPDPLAGFNGGEGNVGQGGEGRGQEKERGGWVKGKGERGKGDRDGRESLGG